MALATQPPSYPLSNLTTLCSHNAPGQVYATDHTTLCRQCGCELEPLEAATSSEPAGTVSPAGVLAGYPGERKA